MLKTYIWALRPFSYTVSLFPALLTALILKYHLAASFSLMRLALIVLACIAAHAGANLISDYVDFQKGIDKESKYGSPSILISGKLPPRAVFIYALSCFLLAFALACFFLFSLPVEKWSSYLLLILLGAIFAVFYTVPPFRFKHRALGDIAVFFPFGPLMFLGSSLLLINDFYWPLFFYSIPIGLLVVAILHANNTRDIAPDKASKIKTLAMILGKDKSVLLHGLYVGGAYFLVLLFALLKIFPLASLFVFLSLPLGISLIKTNTQYAKKSADEYAQQKIDEKTAGLHLSFCLILIIVFLIKVW